MNDYWKEMMDEFLSIGIKTYGLIAGAILVIGIGVKILEWLGRI